MPRRPNLADLRIALLFASTLLPLPLPGAETPAPAKQETQIWLQDVAVSPDGRRIAFSRYEGVGEYKDERWQVWVADRDGGHARPVLASADYVSFSPDGQRLAAGQVIDGDWELVTVKTDGTDLRRLTRHKGHDGVASWSPDGRFLAFSSGEGGNTDLWRVGADGSGLERLTTDPSGDYNPVYSPDGKRLVFYREKGDQQDQVWTLELASRKEERITDGTGHHFFPFYLPDGRLAWSGQPGPKASTAPRRLWIRGADGKLTPFGPEKIFFARATPDGRELFFITQDETEKRIYRQPFAAGEAVMVLDVRPLAGK